VPENLIQQWIAELALHEKVACDDPRHAELRKRIARYEDAGHGACWFREPAVAEMVECALLQFDSARYNLIAWCVMPNHVHALIETRENFPLSDVIHSWKSYSALAANRVLKRTGVFWFREFHDRFIRDAQHFRNTVNYIENNPVAAGLTYSAEKWQFSSAFWNRNQHKNEP